MPSERRMPDLSGLRVAVIGLGLMGRPMARNLRAAGADVVVHNRSSAPQDELVAEGMIPASSPAEAASKVGDGVVVVMVTNTPAMRAVIEGDNGLLDDLRPGAMVIDMGTTQVADTREMADRVRTKGGRYIDAPVSGGQLGAENASLSIMAGASDEDFERALPIFETLGRRVTHVGDVGCGQIAKSANQMIVALTLGAVAEALSLAEKAGADPAKVRDALAGGFADSRILELHGKRMIDREFTPGGRVSVQHKDVLQALELAASVGLDLPGLTLNESLWQRMIENGWAECDHSAIVRLYDDFD